MVERAGVGAARFPVSLALDTRGLIQQGKMCPDGADVRISVAGEEVPFQIEGLGLEDTQITFQVDLKPGETREDVVLHYGNSDARGPEYATDWGSIRPSYDEFENELLHVSYGMKQGTFGWMWGCQKTFVIKRYGEDQFGGERIPDCWAKSRNDVTYWDPNVEAGPTFEVEIDGPVYKRVRFFSAEKIIQHHPGDRKRPVRDLSQRVTFYRGCPFLKEEFENLQTGTTITASPGGMRLRTSDGKRNFDFTAHNLDSERITWNGIGEDRETRGGWTADRARAESDPRYRYIEDYLYHGYLILGVANLHNGRGIGVCANHIQTAFFVDWPHERAGFSIWPCGRRMTQYLYYVEHGREEIIAQGKRLANPPEAVLIGD